MQQMVGRIGTGEEYDRYKKKTSHHPSTANGRGSQSMHNVSTDDFYSTGPSRAFLTPRLFVPLRAPFGAEVRSATSR